MELPDLLGISRFLGEAMDDVNRYLHRDPMDFETEDAYNENEAALAKAQAYLDGFRAALLSVFGTRTVTLIELAAKGARP